MATRSESRGAGSPRRPFRDLAEACTSALVVALLLKLFAVEAYRIPSGSMMPTLLGHEAGDGVAVKDTILVDRLAYLVGDPARFDVAVFRFPLDRSRVFVKRVIGLPGDTLRIAYGDVQRRESDGAWRTLQRPAPVADRMWLALEHHGGWGLVHAAVDARSGDVATAPIVLAPPPGGAAELVFPRAALGNEAEARIVDLYRDGLPRVLRERLAEGGGQSVVGDLRVAFELELPDSPRAARTVTVELHERDGDGWRVYRVTSDHAAGRVEVASSGVARPGDGPAAALPPGAAAWSALATALAPFAPGTRHHVVFQNLDDVVQVTIDGERASGEVAPCEALGSFVRITADGEARVRGLDLARDVHYVAGRSSTDTWTVPAGCYFVLGDNTQRSVDSREWRLAQYRREADPDVGEVVRGQSIPGENPRAAFGEGDAAVWYFRDEWGERQRLPTDAVSMPPPLEAPWVPRDHFIGRATVTLWPLGRGVERFVPTLVR